MPTVPLVGVDSIALECLEITPAGEQGASPARATPHTLQGTGGVSTVVSAALVGATARDYVGCLIEPDEGTEAGQVRQIDSFDPALDTATVSVPWDADPTAGGTIGWRMWRPTDPVCRAEGAGTGTTFVADEDVDASLTPGRDEVVNFWDTPNRYVMVGRGGDCDDEAALITGDAAPAAGTKTFTVEAGGFTTPSAEGDLAAIRKNVRFVDGVIITPDLPFNVVDRVFAKGPAANDEQDPHVVTRIRRDTMIDGAALEIQPVASVAAGATLATMPHEAGDFLESLFDMDADGASVAAGAPTTTNLPITTATQERFGVGNMVLVNGEARQIRTITDGGVADDTLVVAPALTAAPAVGEAITGGVNFVPKNTGFRSHLYEFFVGGRRMVVQGWLPNVEITNIIAEMEGRWLFTGPADSHWEDGLAYPSVFSTSQQDRFPVAGLEVPILAGRSSVLLDGTEIGDTVIEASLNIGYVFSARAAVGTFGGNAGVYRSGRRTTVAELKIHMDNLAYFRRFQTGSSHSLLVQLGSAIGGTFVWFCPAVQFGGQPYANEDGSFVQTIPIRVNRTGINGTDAAANTVRIDDTTIALI